MRLSSQFSLWAFLFLVASHFACRDKGDAIVGPPTPQVTGVSVSLYSNCTYPTFLITNASVTLRSDSLTLTVSSDTSGIYRFENIPTGNYQVTAISWLYDTTMAFVDSLLEREHRTVKLWLNSKRSSFAPGDLLIGFWDTTNLSLVFNFVDSLGVQLKTLGNFKHSTNPIPFDSAASIAAVLRQKPYIDSGFVILDNRGNNSSVSVFYFRNLTRADYLDWLSTRSILSLFEFAAPNKYVHIEVPIGQECSWVQMLKGNPILRYISLNYYGYLS